MESKVKTARSDASRLPPHTPGEGQSLPCLPPRSPAEKRTAASEGSRKPATPVSSPDPPDLPAFSQKPREEARPKISRFLPAGPAGLTLLGL